MNRASCFISSIRFVILALLLGWQGCVYAQDVPPPELLRNSKPVSALETDEGQLALMKARCDREDRWMRNVVIACALLFLFGAFCALWAQYEHRNPLLWFMAGFAFNFLAILAVLLLNRRSRRRKRERRVVDYWNFAHF
jgi:hypothetical protein